MVRQYEGPHVPREEESKILKLQQQAHTQKDTRQALQRDAVFGILFFLGFRI